MSHGRIRPQPSLLSDSALCERAASEGRGGDSERLLVQRHMRMCVSEARDFAPKGMDVGDMESAALMAFQRAIYSFDPGHRVTFRHYAKRIVRNALLDELRKDRRESRRSVPFGLDDPLPSGEGGTISELFADPNAAEYADTAPLRDVLRRFAGKLAASYRLAALGPAGGAPEELRRALAASAGALLKSGTLADSYEVESFVTSLGDKNGQLLLGMTDEDAANRAALALAEAHLAAVIRSVEGDETFRQAAEGLDPDAALAALRLVAEASLPASEEA